VTPLEFRLDLWRQQTSLRLSYGVVCVILRLAVLVQYRRVTDRPTDVDDDSTYRASIASRSKKRAVKITFEKPFSE